MLGARVLLPLARRYAGALWLLGATTFANVLAYGYQVVMARLLRPEDYAVLTAFFAVLILEQLGGQVIQSATARLAATYRALADEAALHVFVRRWTRRIAIGAGIPALLAIALSASVPLPPLTPFAVGLLGATLFFAAMLTFTLGLLQGLARFGWFGTVFIGIAAARLLIGVGLVLVLRAADELVLRPVDGAFLGASAAVAIGVLGTIVPLAPLFRAARGAAHPVELGRAEARFFLLAGVIFLAYAALTFVDGLVAPWRIPAESGAYAAAITMGKIVLFAPIAVGFILLERTARATALGASPRRPLVLAMTLVLVTSGPVALAYVLFPGPLVDLIVGDQYPETARLVGPYGIAALSNAILSLWIAYFVGRGQMRIGALLAVGVAAELALLLSLGSTAEAMVRIVLGVALAMQAAAIATFVLSDGRRRS